MSEEHSGKLAQETQNVLTEREIRLLHEELDTVRKELNALKAERDNAYRWGVLVLGGAVVGMGLLLLNLSFGRLPQ